MPSPPTWFIIVVGGSLLVAVEEVSHQLVVVEVLAFASFTSHHETGTSLLVKVAWVLLPSDEGVDRMND